MATNSNKVTENANNNGEANNNEDANNNNDKRFYKYLIVKMNNQCMKNERPSI